MAAPIEPQAPLTPGASIAQTLNALGPKSVEGDQGRWIGHSVSDAIMAEEYEARKLKNKSKVAAILRTISGHRLLSHDGRAS
jgi:hypothetical protein